MGYVISDNSLSCLSTNVIGIIPDCNDSNKQVLLHPIMKSGRKSANKLKKSTLFMEKR